MDDSAAMTPRRTHAARLPTLDGGRIQLGPWRDADVAGLADLHADARAMRYWSTLPWAPDDQERAERYLDAIDDGARTGELLQFAARLPGDDALVGWVTLYRIEPEHRRCEVGYLLAPALWGQGWGRRMLATALRHAFGPLGLHRVEADVDPRNAGSCRLLESLGFVREGLLRERWRTGGEIQDSAIYGLLAPQFRDPDLKRPLAS
jgi:RimJ/RimL family protein N-acetyltransferase